MRTFLITLLILLLAALVWLGIEQAALQTHNVLGDSSYTPFYQEIF